MTKNLLFTLTALAMLFTQVAFAQPANNDCSEAFAIGSVTDLAFTTLDATTDGPEHPDDCVGSGSTGQILFNDVWYVFTSSFTGTASLSLCGTANFDSKIAVYGTGFSCPPTDDQLIACNEDGAGCAGYTSFTTFPVTLGDSYLLRIGGWGDGATGESGTGTFTVEEYITQPGPPNDNCADAIEMILDANDSTFFEFTNLFANTDGPLHEPASCFDAGEETVYSDVWYFWDATFSGWVEWSNCGTSSFDSRMAIYGHAQSCQPDPDSLVGCSDDGVDPFNINCAGYTSRAVFEVFEGGHYIFRIGGWSSADAGTGTFTFKKVPTPVPPANDLCAAYDTAFVMTTQQADDFDYVFEGYTYNGTFDGFPPPQCLNFGEFFDVWYKFNSGNNENIELRFSSLASQSEFLIDLFQDCGTQIDTIAEGFCINTENYTTDYFTEQIGGFPGVPTDYLMRVSTKITYFPPGEFLFQLVGEPYDPTGTTIPNLNGFRYSPNPVTNEIRLQFDLSNNSNLQVNMLNNLGQVLFSEARNNQAAGHHQLSYDTSSLNAGIYFLQIADGQQVKAVKFIKI